MNAQKWGTVAIYGVMLMIVGAFPGSEAAAIIRWVFLVLVVVHLLEFIMVFKLLKSAGGSMGQHFLQTMLFGFMHWMPIKKQGVVV